MKTLNLSNQFVSELTNQGIEKSEVKIFVEMLIRSFVPVQKISDAMKASSQVSFNLCDNGIKIIDPFNICDTEKFHEVPYEYPEKYNMLDFFKKFYQSKVA